MMTREQIAAQAAALADSDDDMNEATVGGGGSGFGKHFKPGWSIARFTSYIESGKHVELFKGKPKDPKLMCRLGFHLMSPDYLNDDGTPYFIETLDKPRDRNEKSWTFKTFKQMNYKGTAKNFPQLLDEVYLVEIVDYVSKNAPPGSEPMSVIGQITPGVDRISGKPYDAPVAPSLFLFSWAMPTLEAWDSFFVDGISEKTGKSRNWRQEKMAGATDFKGSALEALLMANNRPIPVGTPQKTGASPAGAQPAAAAPAASPAVSVASVAAAPVATPVAVPIAPVVPVVASPVVAPAV